jgi:hypothetical protein
MYYLSTAVGSTGSTSKYDAIHRTYPGILKNDPKYDPPQRTWFKKAPTSGFFLYGPYKETFTGLSVLTISSKQIITDGNGQRPVTIVAASVSLIQSIEKILYSVQYPDNGYGVLVNSLSSEIIVWQGVQLSYNPFTQLFTKLGDVDPKLGNVNLLSSHTLAS